MTLILALLWTMPAFTHVNVVSLLIEVAIIIIYKLVLLCYLSPYSPDLNPTEGVFNQVKTIMKIINFFRLLEHVEQC